MQDKYLESVKKQFISQIEEIIDESFKKSQTENLSVIEILKLINTNIENLIKSVDVSFNIDDEFLKEVSKFTILCAKLSQTEDFKNGLMSKINNTLNESFKSKNDIVKSKTVHTSEKTERYGLWDFSEVCDGSISSENSKIENGCLVFGHEISGTKFHDVKMRDDNIVLWGDSPLDPLDIATEFPKIPKKKKY